MTDENKLKVHENRNLEQTKWRACDSHNYNRKYLSYMWGAFEYSVQWE